MSEPGSESSREYLIACAEADREAAGAVAGILGSAGLTAVVEDEGADTGDTGRYAPPGTSVVALLSEAFLASPRHLAQVQRILAGDLARRRLVLLRLEVCTPPEALKAAPYYDLAPLLDDPEAYARAVRGALAPGRDAAEARFAALRRREGPQLLHGEIRPAPGFAGRAAELAAIDAALWTMGGTAALTDAAKPADARHAATRALGGVGKSTLARQYAWDHRERYAGVWWIAAASRDEIVAGLISLGAHLIPGLDETTDRPRAARLTLDALAQAQGEKPWLLVYDDVGTPAALVGLAPAAGAHLLITTRWPEWHGQAEAIAVDVFPRTLAMDYLLTQSKRGDAAATGRLADELGRLPLALAHARATCASMGIDFDTCRMLLGELIKRAPRDADYPAPVHATLDLALQRAVELSPKADRLLGISAFLAPDRIPLDVVAGDVMSRIERGAAVAALTEVSLATRVPLEPVDDGGPGIAVHRLVQAAMRSRLAAAGTDKEHAALATRLVAQAFPYGGHTSDDVGNWSACRRLEQHARAVLHHAPETGEAAGSTSLLLGQLALHLKSRAEHDEAEPLMRRAVAIDERFLGEHHPDLAVSLGNLARLLQDTDRAGEAEPLMRRALAIQEKAHGTDHPDVAGALSNLAKLFHATGRHDEAEPLMRRALSITESALGSADAAVAARLNDLAQLLNDAGRATEAEALMRRALSISEGCLGKDHPDVAVELGNLGRMLMAGGRLSEAEPLLSRALGIDQAAHGPRHPRVALDLGNLANLLRLADRGDEALALARRALAIDEAAFDPEHPRVAMRYNNVATLLAEIGRPADADPYIRHAVLAAERTLGPDHADTLTYKQNYDDIIANIEEMARRDDAVETGHAPAPPERLARPDIPPPPSRPRSNMLGRLLRKRV